ncbi:MAG: glycosyltransferase [Candidatus Paceibacterota bacterium]|jgi:glycosyltransferase involved in cell wall biosynthesis
MKKENLQIISLSAASTFLNHNSVPSRNLQSQAEKLEKFILINFQRSKYDVEKVENILFIEVPRLKSIFYIKKIVKEIKRELNNNTKSVITAGNPFDLGILGIIFKFCLQMPLQIQIHTDLYSKNFLMSKKRHRLYLLISQITFPFANSIRTVSKNTEQKLKKMYPKKLIKNIIEIADFSYIKIDSEKNNNGLLYLCPARYDEGKNLTNLIEAFIEFHKIHKDTELKIVGMGTLKEELARIVKENDAVNYISLPGWSQNMPNEYTKANFTILPSLFEGFNMSVRESLSYGTPFLATPFGGGTELIIYGKTGFIAKGFSKEDIYNLLLESYKNKDVFDTKIIKDSVKDLTKDNMDKKLIELWKETCE